MKLIISADDFGASKSVTDNILRAHRDGAITHASVIPQGAAVEYAFEQLQNNPDLNIGLHLNVIEGKPMSDSSDVYLLIDSSGNFKYSFISLWADYFFASAQKKKILSEQIFKELGTQIKFLEQRLGDRKISKIDSHEHTHMIPFVFDALMKVWGNNAAVLRIPYDSLRLVSLKQNWRQLTIRNITKNIVLNILSLRARRILRATKIINTNYCLGILLTGFMTAASLRYAIEKIRKQGGEITIEVLFHPGYATQEESVIWKQYPRFEEFYCSPQRQKELRELQKPEMHDFKY